MILLLFWCENATLSFLSSLSSIAASSAEQQSHACFRFKSTSEWSAGQVVLHKGNLISFIQYTKERLFQNNNRQQEQNALDEYVHLFQPPRKLGSCSNLCFRDFANVTLKTRAWVGRWSGCITTTTITTSTLVLTLLVESTRRPLLCAINTVKIYCVCKSIILC